MADEARVDQSDAAIGGNGREEPCGLARVGGGLYVEAQ